MVQTVSPVQALQQQRLLLQLEYQTEKETFRKQTEEMGVQRKVKRGDAWWPLKVGKSYYNSLNQLAIEVFRTADQDIEHTFEFGKTVMFFHMDENRIKYFSFTATVSYVDGDRMVCILPNNGYLVTLQNTENVYRLSARPFLLAPKGGDVCVSAYAFSLSERHSGRGGQYGAEGEGCRYRSWTSGHW